MCAREDFLNLSIICCISPISNPFLLSLLSFSKSGTVNNITKVTIIITLFLILDYSISDGIICPECGKLFKTKETLIQHENTIHKHVARYRCNAKRFLSKSHLTRHRCNVHGEEKRFQCTNCNKRFPINADLTRHIRRESGKLKYVFAECSTRYETKAELEEHKGTHTYAPCGNQCDICFKTFSFKTNLYRHKKNHTK